MIWYDMIWYDMIWYDMIWYDMIWYDMQYIYKFTNMCKHKLKWCKFKYLDWINFSSGKKSSEVGESWLKPLRIWRFNWSQNSRDLFLSHEKPCFMGFYFPWNKFGKWLFHSCVCFLSEKSQAANFFWTKPNSQSKRIRRVPPRWMLLHWNPRHRPLHQLFGSDILQSMVVSSNSNLTV